MQNALTANILWKQGEKPCRAAFDIKEGVTALIGPSGAGKTTTARMLAGLSTPQSGTIMRGKHPLFDTSQNINLPAAQRSVGYVTQEPALFPTMSVAENILLGAKLAPTDLAALYAITGTENLLGRNPRTLSGGEARRVAIVRALAAKPSLLILDEPMNGLDPKRRKSLLTLIRHLSHQMNTPTLLITHQIEEMLIAADHAILVADGNTLLSGSIEQVLSAPETSQHLGIDDAGSILTATVTGRQEGLLTANIGEQTILLSDDGEPMGSKLRLRILARDVGVATGHIDNVSILNQLSTTVRHVRAAKHEQLVTLALTGTDQHITARITDKSAKALNINEGTKVHALIKAVAVKEMMAD